MPGGGITSQNIAELSRYTGIKEFHGSFRKRYEGKMQFVTDKLGSFEDEYTILHTDYKEVKTSIENANSIY